jgi:hypothetical protein
MFLEMLIRSTITDLFPQGIPYWRQRWPFYGQFRTYWKVRGEFIESTLRLANRYDKLANLTSADTSWCLEEATVRWIQLQPKSDPPCSRYERDEYLLLRSLTKLCSLHGTELRETLLKLSIHIYKPHWNFKWDFIAAIKVVTPNCATVSTNKVSLLVNFFFFSPLKENPSQTLDLSHMKIIQNLTENGIV